MAFIQLPLSWIQAGQPTKEELFQYIRDNQESFNTDIEALKQTAVIDIFDVNICGQLNDYDQVELNVNMPVFKSPVACSITSVVLTLLEASTSGTLGVQLEKSVDNGINWTPIFSTPVQITTNTVGSVSTSVNFVDASFQEVAQNDLLRISVDTLQVDQGNFHVSVYGELA